MKKLKRSAIVLSALIALLTVAGCGRVVIEGEYIQQAGELCSDNGGVENISKRDHILPNYKCKNGVAFKIYNDSISKSTPSNSDS